MAVVEADAAERRAIVVKYWILVEVVVPRKKRGLVEALENEWVSEWEEVSSVVTSSFANTLRRPLRMVWLEVWV